MAYARTDPAIRFWAKVRKPSASNAWQTDTSHCWEWLGAGSPHGYGNFGSLGKTYRAHRVAYELTIGPVPEGMHLDHLCRNRRCVNPAHLDPVTNKENLRRGESGRALMAINAAKRAATHCQRGHEMSGDNVMINARRGDRACRACHKIVGAAYYQKTLAARRAVSNPVTSQVIGSLRAAG